MAINNCTLVVHHLHHHQDNVVVLAVVAEVELVVEVVHSVVHRRCVQDQDHHYLLDVACHPLLDVLHLLRVIALDRPARSAAARMIRAPCVSLQPAEALAQDVRGMISCYRSS